MGKNQRFCRLFCRPQIIPQIQVWISLLLELRIVCEL